MQATGGALPGMLGGIFSILLGVLCFAFNRRLGRWLRRLPVAVFGLKEGAADEMIFRGLACLAGLLYAGFGLVLLSQLLN